jgi:membrane glycosyltransferase
MHIVLDVQQPTWQCLCSQRCAHGTELCVACPALSAQHQSSQMPLMATTSWRFVTLLLDTSTQAACHVCEVVLCARRTALQDTRTVTRVHCRIVAEKSCETVNSLSSVTCVAQVMVMEIILTHGGQTCGLQIISVMHQVFCWLSVYWCCQLVFATGWQIDRTSGEAAPMPACRGGTPG